MMGAAQRVTGLEARPRLFGVLDGSEIGEDMESLRAANQIGEAIKSMVRGTRDKE